MERCDIAIIGAGPYGLSAATYLQQVGGLDVRLFGEPMSFWERMPPEMHLRSPWAGSHIADPRHRLTLDVYRSVNGNGRLEYPIPLKGFIDYGRWFHQQTGLSADRRQVIRLELTPVGYQLALENGDALHSRRVVVAAGVQHFAHRPNVFEGVPACLVTHTSEQRDFGKFRDREVLVIGGGQSAFEAAVFLHEAGARVELFARNSVLHWVPRMRWMRQQAIRWMFYGRGEVGSAGVSLIIQRPNVFRRLPRRLQARWGPWATRPAIADWLKPRVDMPIHLGRCPVEAHVDGTHLRVRFDDGVERVADHVVLGTGYRIDVGRYPFFSSDILERMDIVNGYPRLDEGFETSVPGLHILGAPAAWSFGPLMKFVAGTEFASPALRARVLRTHLRPAVSLRGRATARPSTTT
jgi:FAD-dependent urate hydroxylase